MRTLHYYGIIAANFSEAKKHQDHISEVLVVEVDTDGHIHYHAKTHTKDEAAKLKPLYTMVWNYSTGKWARGAAVNLEHVKDKTYLRSKKNNTEEDNLSHLSSIESYLSNSAQ